MSTASPWNLIPLRMRLALFRVLETVAALRTKAAMPSHPVPATDAAQRSLWIFVSTIGELNAIEPFVGRLLQTLGHPALTLISDRGHYADAYRAKYPGAHLETTDGSTAQVQALAARRPPLLMLVAEIPCLLHDAPCRLSFATLHAARRAGAPVVLVNGWLYGYAAPSRMDGIERRLFASDYVRAFDLLLVQTDAVRTRLVAAGADPKRVVVTGNIKFDAMLAPQATAHTSALGAALVQRGAHPLVVAGSVSEERDQRAVIAAFCALRAQAPGALLLLAPRHPENRERMRVLESLLRDAALDYRLRSRHAPGDAVSGAVLVLDTMGELRGCYAATTFAYVGTDHNVLEPLAYGKPVFVSEGWEPTFPSYPVYRQLLDCGVLHDVGPVTNLGAAWLAHINQPAQPSAQAYAQIDAALALARGAVERDLAALQASGVLRALGPSSAPGTRSDSASRAPAQ